MDLKSDTPYLLIANGILASYPPLTRDQTCDVAILGGGVTGALVAHQLIEAGLDVVLLDKRDIAQGSTSVTTGLLQYEIDVHLTDLIEKIGERDAVRAYQLCCQAIDKIGELASSLDDDCGFRQRDSLYFASDSDALSDLAKECEARARAGFDVRWLTAEEILEHYHFRAPGAILSTAGGHIDAFRLAHRLIERCAKRGLRVFDRTTVTEWKPTESSVRLTTDRDAVVEAKHVVFATGYESQSYLRQKVVSLKSTYALVSQVFPERLWRDDALIWETARPYLYLRRTEEGRVMLGGDDDEFRNPLLRDSRVEMKTRKLVKRFEQMFPGVPLEAEWSWAGTFGETKDGLAYIGATPEIPRALFAMGFGGNGITFSAIAAEILRDAILGKTNADARLFRFER